MPVPFFFIVLPLLAGPIAFGLLRRWPPAEVGLAASIAALLGLLAPTLPLDQPIPPLGNLILSSSLAVLGRTFVMEPVDRLGLAFVFTQAALLFLGSWFTRTGRFYRPAGLAVLGLLAAAMLIQPFLFAALFLELAAVLTVLMLGDDPSELQDFAGHASRVIRSADGALRFLVFMTLSMPFILLTGWLLEANAASPEDTSLIFKAAILLAVGLAVLLAIAPFHSWLPLVGEHAPPLATAFVLTVMFFPAVFLLLTFLNTYDWLGQNPALYRALTLGGSGMALIGALFAFGQRNFGRTLGYVMMIDVGALLLAIGLETRAGLEAALVTLAWRGLALTLWGLGLSRLREAAGGDDFDSLRGLGWRYPLASAAVVVGLLSLVGFPLTVGFTGRWALLYLLAQIHPSAAILLLLGMVSISLVCARGLTALLTPSREAVRKSERGAAQENRLALGVYGAALGVLFALGVFPQWLLPAIARAASVFTHLVP
jgi:NADH-quinone oxidoreductase subunit N